MADEFAVDLVALGASVRLRTDDPDRRATLEHLWSGCAPLDRTTPEITIDVDHLAPGAGEAETLERTSQEVTVRALELRAETHLLLHACAVARDGRGAIFVGPSGMGKTTLAATLGRRWDYVTDEAVAVASDGEVLPYPKPLSIRLGQGAKKQTGPSEIGLTPARSVSNVAAVWLLDRRPGHPGAPLVEPVETIEALPVLADHTSYLRRLPRPLQQMAGILQRADGLHRVTYRESRDVTKLLASLFEAP